jgi:hypothetical protein
MRLQLLGVLAAALVLGAACGGDGGGDSGNGGGSGKFTTKCGAPEAGKANIVGQVKDAWGAIVSGEGAVTFGTETGDVNGYGRFYICNVAAGQEYVVTVNIPKVYQWGAFNGYSPVSKTLTLADGEERLLNFRVKASQFNALDATAVAAGGNVTDGSTMVTFPANAFVTASGAAFTGAVNVQLATFDASNPDDLESFPGDFAGTDAGTEVGLFSLGFVNVQLFDDDQKPLQLAEGKKATLVFPVKNLDPADTTIPMWYFDEAQGTWIREGEGTVDQGTGLITAEVAHFSTWNADKPVTLTDCVTGIAQDTEGNPIPGAFVYGTGQGSGKADAQGKFCVNFYPRSSFQLRGNFFEAGVVFDAITPYTSFSGTREGGQNCDTPAACEVLPGPVVFQGVETATHCLNIKLSGATATHKSGTLMITNATGGAVVYSAKMGGSASACVEIPEGYQISAYLNVFADGKEAFCGVSTFNGTDVSQGGTVTISAGGNACGEGACDELVMKCQEFSGHPM